MTISRKFTILAILTSAAVVGLLSLDPARNAQARDELIAWLRQRAMRRPSPNQLASL